MKIFLGWSGGLSRQLADAFHTWIKNVIQEADPFFSVRDIDKGVAWHSSLTSKLKTCAYGIFFITDENCANPWMHFEAGALSKEIGDTRVCPFLFGIHQSKLDGPFAHFQAVRLDEDDIFKLVESINNAADKPLSKDHLKDSFATYWPRLHHKISEIESSTLSADIDKASATRRGDVKELREMVRSIVNSHSIHQHGLRAIYDDRIHALREIREEIDSEAKEIVIIGSSLKGVIGLGSDTAGDQNLIRIALFDALRRGVKVKILMTSPVIAHYRAKQEGRGDGEIEGEILENLVYLHNERLEDNVVAKNLEIKLYKGTPTLFLVSTSHAMFFNPYTYYSQAYKTFCFRAGKTTSIFKNYYDHHYREAWQDGRHSTMLKNGRAAIKQLVELIKGENSIGDPIVPDDDDREELLGKLGIEGKRDGSPKRA